MTQTETGQENMTQTERIDYLIRRLLEERKQDPNSALPDSFDEKWRLFRSLVNVRPPAPIDDGFLQVQDALLQEETAAKGVVDIRDLLPRKGNLYLWRGDITRLKVDAIVNAANSALLGCFAPCHACIDNTIHTFAGVQLRLECDAIMKAQGHAEPTGNAKITKAYNLPSRFVIHTVGPIITGSLTQEDCVLLASCYRSCLKLAAEHDLESIAFCCISTGEFHFPQDKAAEIAVETVRAFLPENDSKIKVIFNVFNETDERIYRHLL